MGLANVVGCKEQAKLAMMAVDEAMADVDYTIEADVAVEADQHIVVEVISEWVFADVVDGFRVVSSVAAAAGAMLNLRIASVMVEARQIASVKVEARQIASVKVEAR